MAHSAVTRTLASAVTWSLCAIFPDSGVIPGLRRARTQRRVANVLSEAPPTFIVGLVGSWLAFVLTPLLTIGWPVPALFLGKEALDRHASAMSSHPLYLLRQAMLMLKTVGGAIWGEDDDVRAALGLQSYGPDPGTWRGDFQVVLDEEEGP